MDSELFSCKIAGIPLECPDFFHAKTLLSLTRGSIIDLWPLKIDG